jgi:Ca2+/Na+ antiporter
MVRNRKKKRQNLQMKVMAQNGMFFPMMMMMMMITFVIAVHSHDRQQSWIKFGFRLILVQFCIVLLLYFKFDSSREQVK